MRYGEDIIEEVTEYINDIGCEVDCYEDENGAGREYALSYSDGSMLFQEHQYRDLCQKILTEINTAKISITENIIQKEFRKFEGPSKEKEKEKDFPAVDLSAEERSLIEKFRQLDEDGKIMLQSTMITELRRIK